MPYHVEIMSLNTRKSWDINFRKSFVPGALCSSRKNPYPPHERSLKIPREWGLKSQNLEAKYEAKLEI